MRIRHEAARYGWVLFSREIPHPTLEDINAELDRVGLPNVARRTYDHYGRLARYEVADYIPINEFDIARKNGLFDERESA